ncbi:helix-turn-helix domain-containing protein [Selenomonas ruminantium]|uniref:helix-turn-helix domain-containing protein n=1 Tax=Selenomonas ruminantium TaxID=971 RepID=UPI001569CF11|nr:helix-turn-helix transcriptional regulator [Selenomonas ruminantium]
MTNKTPDPTGEKLKITGTFAKRLRELRENRGLYQSDMAKMLGIAVASYANWEQGRTLPALTYLPTLASFFNVTTDYLLGISKQDAVDRVRERMMKLPKSSQVLVESLIEEMLKK